MLIKSDRINLFNRVPPGDAIGFIQAGESEDRSHDRFRGRRGRQLGETGAAAAGRGRGRPREREGVGERREDRAQGQTGGRRPVDAFLLGGTLLRVSIERSLVSRNTRNASFSFSLSSSFSLYPALKE